MDHRERTGHEGASGREQSRTRDDQDTDYNKIRKGRVEQSAGHEDCLEWRAHLEKQQVGLNKKQEKNKEESIMNV